MFLTLDTVINTMKLLGLSVLGFKVKIVIVDRMGSHIWQLKLLLEIINL
jgi:hypothetical protein